MTPNDFTAQKGGGNILFLPHIYAETMELLVHAHDYFHSHGADDQERLDPRLRSLYCSEMSRITMRLSCIMAWLLARRALSAEENSVAMEIGNYRLDCREMCLHQNIEAESCMPPFMNHLLTRSYDLYERVARLDDAAVDPNHPGKNQVN